MPINQHGTMLDFYFSPKRNNEAAYQFLKRRLTPYDLTRQPKTLNTNKQASNGHAIVCLEKEGRLGLISAGKIWLHQSPL